ncbi:hypothetical protein [Myroides sp. N17-2]|uniref:hypothetical protein n=1 Tax=Myroides sp. N17-2 TaxID=2030799 RepID=UPI00130449BD|nr:hypothetical protein [Myroides sp. N17-2]
MRIKLLNLILHPITNYSTDIMRNTLVVLSLFLGLNLSAQSKEAPLEKSEKWVNYTTIIEKTLYLYKYVKIEV